MAHALTSFAVLPSGGVMFIWMYFLSIFLYTEALNSAYLSKKYLNDMVKLTLMQSKIFHNDALDERRWKYV